MGNKIKVKCSYCNSDLEKSDYELKGHKNVFCNKECANSFMRGKENTSLKKRYKVKCYFCNHEFEIQPYRLKNTKRFFCSRECQTNWKKSDEYKTILKSSERPKVEKVAVNCSHCDSTIYKLPSQMRGSFNFCNTECRKNYFIKNNPNPKKEKVSVNCFNCDQEFEVNESIVKKNKYHFCSRKCYWDWKKDNLSGENSPLFNRVEVKCANCDSQMHIIPFDLERNKHNFCSQECYWEFRSKFYFGENHHLYGTTKTDEEKEKQRILTVKMYKDGVFDRQTSIQKNVNEILDDLNIKYENEYSCKYYSIDNFLLDYNLMIEVMGDYWHSNPIKYKKYDDLNSKQKDGVRRDKSKRTYIKKYHNISVLYLWEKDIIKNKDLCVELIKQYIENKGILDDYNSFNYYLDENNKIQIHKQIISPYFTKQII